MAQALKDNAFKLEMRDAAQVYSKIEKATEASHLLNRELSDFARGLNEVGYSYVIIKGQTLALLYPHPDVRTVGDIDIFINNQEQYEHLKTFLEKRLNTSLEKLSDGKHVEFEYNGCEFEIHNILTQLSQKKNQQYFDQVIDAAMQQRYSITIDQSAVFTLPPTINILYTFIHLFFHLSASGCGLRQFCDLTMLIYKKMPEADATELASHLKSLELYKAFLAVGAFLVEELSLPEESFPFQLTAKDRRWASIIRKNIIRGGNFGRSRRKVKKELKILHSIESGWLTLNQQFTFWRLAPKEVQGRFLTLFSWFFSRFKQ